MAFCLRWRRLQAYQRVVLKRLALRSTRRYVLAFWVSSGSIIFPVVFGWQCGSGTCGRPELFGQQGHCDAPDCLHTGSRKTCSQFHMHLHKPKLELRSECCRGLVMRLTTDSCRFRTAKVWQRLRDSSAYCITKR